MGGAEQRQKARGGANRAENPSEKNAGVNGWAQVLSFVSIGACIVAPDDWRILYANDSLATMLGRIPADIVGTSPLDFVARGGDGAGRKELGPRLREHLLREGAWSGELQLVRRNGREFWCRCSIGRGHLPEVGEVFVGFHVDASREREAHQIIHLRDQQFRAVLSGLRNMTVGLGRPDGTILAVEGCMETLRRHGVRKEDLLGKRAQDVAPDPAYVEDLQQALDSKRPVTSLRRMKLPGGEFWLETTFFALEDQDGRTSGVLVIHHDVTERKETEESLLRKNIALQEMAAVAQRGKQDAGQDVLANVERLILPIVHEMEADATPQQADRLRRLKHHLQTITSPFANEMSRTFASLTTAELAICEMIARGLSSKEIASIQHISTSTVSKHRERIRAKLGLAGTDTNLATFLRSQGRLMDGIR